MTTHPVQPVQWLQGGGPESDVVLSSRARLARNLAGCVFNTVADRGLREEILDTCRARIIDSGLGRAMTWVDLHSATALDRSLLVERHLISLQHARGKQTNGSGGPEEPRAVVHAGDLTSIMVNEEDHLRIQAVRPGFDLPRALAEADAIDDTLEAGLDYAFHPRFGYLTACPTNVGTGIRLSVMLHLPALRLTGNIEKMKQAVSDMSLALRGFHGEGSDAAGDLYQVSNQTTLGKTEAVLMQELQQQIIPQIVGYERHERKVLQTKRVIDLHDQVHRALGTLTHARLMTTEESLQLLSLVRLGVVSGVLTHLDLAAVNNLLILTQPAHLQRAAGKELDQDRRRAARADLLRARLTHIR